MAIPAIVNYIVAELERGTPKEQIGKALIEGAGWKPKDIESSFLSIGIEPPPLPVKAKMLIRLKETVGYGGLLLAALLVVALLAWYLVVAFRTPQYIVQKAIEKLLSEQFVTATILSKAEITAPGGSFDRFFGTSGDIPLREILNGTLRVVSATNLEDPTHPQFKGTIRL